MANDRGGLQPTPEGGNPLVFLRDLKDKVEYLIVQIEDTLATNPTSTSALRRRIKDLVKAWMEFEAQYDRLLPGRGGFYASLQHRYLEVLARTEAALKKKLTGALKTSNSIRATHATTQNPSESCPACRGTHIAMGSNGKTYYKTRLSNCEAFTSKSVDERATIIQQTRGCILCLD